MPRVSNPQVLVGFDTADDAGVYRLTADLALVQTVDFFTPIVDDPFTFGAIAAANSLSDVYAMGGRPITALSILAWPGEGEFEDLAQILQGGAEKMQEAGCAILGGHSVNDPEIKFGYAVTGTVHPDRVLANAGARPGDVLLLTKRIGTGVISTALKRGIAEQAHVDASIRSMLTLNRAAAEALEGLEVHSLTDVTGFGLLGHAREMARASGVTLEIEAARVPLLEGALEYARRGAIPAGLKNNREFVGPCLEGSSPLEDLLYDPQTSGGLLISIAPADAGEYTRRFAEAVVVGRVIERRELPLRVL
jgi:selenide,water dikinase